MTERRTRNAGLPEPTYFAAPEEFRDWLIAHHDSASELWVGFHKKATGRPSLTWPESVDEALCFGWIDGVRYTVDSDRYRIRFTPRRRGSNWSEVNVRRAQELIARGRMHEAGLRAFEARDPARTASYSFEQRHGARLSESDEQRFQEKEAAWRFFQSQPPGYRRMAFWWVMSAKRDATRQRRLQQLIEDSAAGRRIGQAEGQG